MKKVILLTFLFAVTFLTQAQGVLYINGATTAVPTLYVNSGAHLNVSGGVNVSQSGSPAGASNDYIQNNGTIQIVSNGSAAQGDFDNNVSGLKVYTNGQTTGEVIFADSSQVQTITGGGTVEFLNLSVTNMLSPNVDLNEDITVDGTLNLGRVINVLGNNLTLASSGTLTGAPYTTANMVQADSTGQFICGISVGANSYLFPVGDGTPAYSPVNLDFSANSVAGNVGINLRPVAHPDINNPSPATDYLKRYWTFSDTGLTNYTYTGNFNYLPADIVGTEANLKLSRWANPWDAYASSAAANSLVITSAIDQSTGPLTGGFTGRNQDCSLATVEISPSDSTICASDSVQICATGSFQSFLWNNGDTTSCIYAKIPGGYWVNATATNGCQVTSQHANITIHSVPSVSLDVSGDTLTSFGDNGYQWYLNDSLIANANSPLYVARQTGNYSVEVTDTFGCTATSNSVYLTVTGINGLSGTSGISIYPDPFTDNLYCKTYGTNSGIQKIAVYDVLGRMVFDQKFDSGEQLLEISSSNLVQGIYYLKIKTQDATYVRQVIKQ